LVLRSADLSLCHDAVELSESGASDELKIGKQQPLTTGSARMGAANGTRYQKMLRPSHFEIDYSLMLGHCLVNA
jgi:hypothetical protein